MDVQDGKCEENQPVVLSDCNDSPTQHWTATDSGEIYSSCDNYLALKTNNNNTIVLIKRDDKGGEEGGDIFFIRAKPKPCKRY